MARRCRTRRTRHWSFTNPHVNFMLLAIGNCQGDWLTLDSGTGQLSWSSAAPSGAEGDVRRCEVWWCFGWARLHHQCSGWSWQASSPCIGGGNELALLPRRGVEALQTSAEHESTDRQQRNKVQVTLSSAVDSKNSLSVSVPRLCSCDFLWGSSGSIRTVLLRSNKRMDMPGPLQQVLSWFNDSKVFMG